MSDSKTDRVVEIRVPIIGVVAGFGAAGCSFRAELLIVTVPSRRVPSRAEGAGISARLGRERKTRKQKKSRQQRMNLQNPCS
jgi:hypothetical protein